MTSWHTLVADTPLYTQYCVICSNFRKRMENKKFHFINTTVDGSSYQ